MSEVYGYTYVTTNILNGKRYIGQHMSKKFNPNYHGSGKYISLAIKKYGENNFVTEVLEWCYSKRDLNRSERYWIDYYNAAHDRDNFYNIADGGQNNCVLTGENHPNHGGMSDEAKRNMSENHYDCNGENNPFYGKKHTEKSRKSMSESHKIENISDEYRSNMSKAQKRRMSDPKNHPMNGNHHTSKTKKKISDNHPDFSGSNNPCYGKKLLNNGIINKYFSKDEIDTKLSEGWGMGKCKK